MDTRRILTGILLGAALLAASSSPLRAQEIVHDPMQTGVAIENSAQSISEMIAMLEQMYINNETLKDIWGAGEKIFDVANRFKDAGQLVELTESYNKLLKMATDYARRIDDWKNEEYFNGYERMMRYITRCITDGQKLIESYQNFFKYLKTNDKDKIDVLEKAQADILAEIDGMTFEYEDIESELRLGEDIISLTRLIEGGSTSSGYAKVYESLGSKQDMAGSWIRVVRVIIALLLILFVIVAFIQTGKNQASVEGPAAIPFTRYFSITVIVYALLELLNSIIY